MLANLPCYERPSIGYTYSCHCSVLSWIAVSTETNIFLNHQLTEWDAVESSTVHNGTVSLMGPCFLPGIWLVEGFKSRDNMISMLHLSMLVALQPWGTWEKMRFKKATNLRASAIPSTLFCQPTKLLQSTLHGAGHLQSRFGRPSYT